MKKLLIALCAVLALTACAAFAEEAAEPATEKFVLWEHVSKEIDENGTEIGVLTDVLQHGTVDTWVFRTASGTLMAPALLSVFPAVDPENKAIDVIRERLEEVAVRS